jgi:hypothetical protein
LELLQKFEPILQKRGLEKLERIENDHRLFSLLSSEVDTLVDISTKHPVVLERSSIDAILYAKMHPQILSTDVLDALKFASQTPLMWNPVTYYAYMLHKNSQTTPAQIMDQTGISEDLFLNELASELFPPEERENAIQSVLKKAQAEDVNKASTKLLQFQ